MPPEGLNINVTAKQLIAWLGSAFITSIGILYLLMTQYFAGINTTVKETTDNYKKVESLLNAVTNDQEDFVKSLADASEALTTKIETTHQDQLQLRRRVLKKDLKNLTAREQSELEDIEELMIMRGYLNPDLRTVMLEPIITQEHQHKSSDIID